MAIAIVNVMNIQQYIYSKGRFTILRDILIVAGVSLALIYSSVFTFTQITRISAPAMALIFNSSEPVSLTIQADQYLVDSLENKALQKKVKESAIISLRSQALNPRALRILSNVLLTAQNQEGMRRLLALTIRASRREAKAHFLLIEDYVARNDVNGALKHYDLALRTSSSSAAVLQPLLINALNDERIVTAFVPYLKRRPSWLYPFLWAAVTESKSPQNVAALILRSGGLPNGPQSASLENSLLSQLLSSGQFAVARDYFLSLKSADPRVLVSPSLFRNNVSDRFPPLAWQPFNASASGMSVINGVGQNAALLVFAGTGQREVVARKMLFLEYGNYRMELRFGASQIPAGGGLRWSIHCAGTQPVKIIGDSGLVRPSLNAVSTMNFAVPANCIAQNIDIEMVGGQEQRGAEVAIASIKLDVEADNELVSKPSR